MLGHGSTAWAANSTPDAIYTFWSGQACPFNLQIEIWNGKQNFKEFKDKNGVVVRSILAGKSSALRYTNLDTNATLSSKSDGAAAHTTYNTDKSQTLELTGHSVVILSPTDSPPGPSTTLREGRVVIKIDPQGNWIVEEDSGKKTDICAALS